MADLPEPVDITHSVSRPARTDWIDSACPGRSSWNPSRSRARSRSRSALASRIPQAPPNRRPEKPSVISCVAAGGCGHATAPELQPERPPELTFRHAADPNHFVTSARAPDDLDV